MDILLENSETGLKTSIYRKDTYTGLLLNFKSFTPSIYKKGLIKTLIDRTFQINNTWIGFHLDLKNLRTIILKNEYPEKQFDLQVNKYLNKKLSKEQSGNSIEKEEQKLRYFKLPYIGKFSDYTQKKINKLIKQFCKDNIKIKLVFDSFKISSMFSTKDKIPHSLKSFVVYKFVCARCNACYVGETSRHLNTRIKEHLTTDKQSHIYKHLSESEECRMANNANSFKIIDTARSKYTLKIKEGLHIQWLKPNLNVQVKCVTSSILV